MQQKTYKRVSGDDNSYLVDVNNVRERDLNEGDFHSKHLS